MTKRKKKFTVPEFKTWLDGIMQFQDKDWSPTREQWEEIYEQIMNLKEPVNKEKMGLNENALDEINGIVYDNVREAMANMPPPVMHNPNHNHLNHPNPNPQMNTNPDPQNMGGQVVNPPPQAGDELANKSLSQLRQEAEERHNAASKHKLPDHNSAEIPEDFV